MRVIGGVDSATLHAWLVGRSLARRLPAPVLDRGGYRVETGSAAEVRRWVFPHIGAGLIDLGRDLRAPRHLLKLCGTDAELRSALRGQWIFAAPSYFMIAGAPRGARPLAPGYTVEIAQRGAVVEACITHATGEPVASGFAAETADAFVYDRIATVSGHRRQGLGVALMTALRSAKRGSATPELLVATEDGRALYETLGWRTLSPYATASTPDD